MIISAQFIERWYNLTYAILSLWLAVPLLVLLFYYVLNKIHPVQEKQSPECEIMKDTIAALERLLNDPDNKPDSSKQ